MKLDLPSFNKRSPAPAFLQRPAPLPKPEPILDVLPRRFTADERHTFAKAWASAALRDMAIAKAQRSEALAKRAAFAAESDALIKADLAKADNMLRKVEQLAKETDDLAKRLKELEDQPLPPKTAGPHAVWVQ